MEEALFSITETRISFGDLDPMGIVWHGNYYGYMEIGREAYGREHDLDAMRMHDQGFFTPIVRSVIEHKAPLTYADIVTIRTWMEPSPAAKIILHYELRNKATDQIVATGETLQVFLDRDRKLVLDMPPFFAEWRERHLPKP